MKNCIRCGESKPLSEYYAHKEMSDGHLNKCKACCRKDATANQKKRRSYYAAYWRKRQRTPERQAKLGDYRKQQRKRHPEKYKAWTKLNNAIRDGKICRLPCEICGNLKSEGHHDDYSKPLEVRWLCFKCHREEAHGQITN